MHNLTQKVVGITASLVLASANPNSNLKGSLQTFPQAPIPTIPSGTGYDQVYNKLALQGHNTYRRAHQVCDMKFSSSAARKAQEWAEYLNKNKVMKHSTSTFRNRCGENIAMHSWTDYISSTNVATQMWYDEVTKPGYDFNNQGFSMGTGHFTQVVWKGSTELGCGISGPYVVCHYCNTAGNMRGAFERNVFPRGPEAKCDNQEESTPSDQGSKQNDDSNKSDNNQSLNQDNNTSCFKKRVRFNARTAPRCSKNSDCSPCETCATVNRGAREIGTFCAHSLFCKRASKLQFKCMGEGEESKQDEDQSSQDPDRDDEPSSPKKKKQENSEKSYFLKIQEVLESKMNHWAKQMPQQDELRDYVQGELEDILDKVFEQMFWYRGKQTKTRSGKTCLNWANEYTLGQIDRRNYKRYGLGNHNYCRNPKSYKGETIWCQVAKDSSSDKAWDYCDPLEDE